MVDTTIVIGVFDPKSLTNKPASKAEIEKATMPDGFCKDCVHCSQKYCHYWLRPVMPDFNTCHKLRVMDSTLIEFISRVEVRKVA